MSADRELVELAAKAAGIELADAFTYNQADGAYRARHGFWHPLEDDGDAFRLSVKLGFEVEHTLHFCHVRSELGEKRLWIDEQHNDDPCAATRRAIVRAAAEIGASL